MMALASLVKLSSTVLLICKRLWSPPIYTPELKRCLHYDSFSHEPGLSVEKTAVLYALLVPLPWFHLEFPEEAWETNSVSGNDNTILHLWFVLRTPLIHYQFPLMEPPVNFLQNIPSCLHYFLPSLPRKTQVRGRAVCLCFTNEETNAESLGHFP